MTALEFLIWGTAMVGYAVLSRGLFLATDGARQSLVDLAGTLIESRDISKEEKDEIRSLLETVHSSLCAWLMAFAVFFALVRLPFVRSPKQPTIPPMLRETHDSFTSRWIVATLGNSLIASTLFALLFLIAAALHVSFYVLARSLISMRRHHHHHHRRDDRAPA